MAPMRALSRLALPLLVTAAADAGAVPRLECHASYGGLTQRLVAAPVDDPYRPPPMLEFEDRFRLKAVVAGDAARVEYVKLYAWDLDTADGRPLLLQQATYLAPVARPAPQPEDALTGAQRLYSAARGRELQWGCALLDAAQAP